MLHRISASLLKRIILLGVFTLSLLISPFSSHLDLFSPAPVHANDIVTPTLTPLPLEPELLNEPTDQPSVEAEQAADPPAAEVAAELDQASFRIFLPSIRVTTTISDPNSETTAGNARGYLITPQELRAIKLKADQGLAPYAANVKELLNHSTLASATSWVSQASISGTPYCSDGSQKDAAGKTLPKGPDYLLEGSRLIYAKMLVANLRTGSSAEAYARNARTRILDLVDTTNWGGSTYSTDNQCILYLSWYIPGFIMAADLLEAFPQIWTGDDKRSFQRWLGTQVYPKVAWASRSRTNNWGSGGSYAAAVIADYLHDSGLTLQEIAPQRRTLSPGLAYAEHTAEQLSRMNTTVTDRDKQDSRCLPLKGIQPHGGIPDELRRARISDAAIMCTAAYLPSISGGYSSAYNYQMLHLEHLIAHAELALRRGDKRLYANLAADKSGSLLQAIKFIIRNPTNPSASYDWDVNRKAMLFVAYRYYRDPAIRDRLQNSGALRSGHTISYGRLTHGFAANETPALPPTVAPPTR